MRLQRTLTLRSLLSISSLGATLVVSTAQAAHTWKLDPSFGTQGQVTTSYYDSPDCAGLVIQANGRIIACGSDVVNDLRAITLGGYRKNGELDPKFGISGKVALTFAYRNSTMFQAALQKDGKIVLAGTITRDRTFNDSDPCVVRFLSDGDLDPTFGSNGLVTTPVGKQKTFLGVAVQRDGKIVAAGDAGDGSVRFVVARYLSGGSLDPSFGSGGTVLSDFGVGASIAQAVALQRDGKILVAGNSQAGPVVVRLNADGTPDPTFGSSGAAVLASVGANVSARALAVQKDGRIVVTGSVPTVEVYVARLNSDGSADAGFGTGGVATGTPGEGRSVLVQKDGRIVISGGSGDGAGFVERFTTSGLADTTFAPAGTVAVSAAGAEIALTRAALQKDGRIVVGGTIATAASTRVLLQRYRK